MDFYIVDCFAKEKYQGNELLVIIADRPMDDEEQQKIAREINFSETAFVLSDKQSNGGYDVRIWTPNVGEVPFAGHPTLGTAHVIREMIEHGTNKDILLNLKVGQIPVSRSARGQMMSQNPPVFGATIEKQEICDVFGIGVESVSERFPIQWVSTGLASVLIPLKDLQALSEIKMDQNAFKRYIARHPKNNCNHLFFTETGDHIFAARCMMEDFVEDPATGSANGNLAAYMLEHHYYETKDVSYTVIQGEDMGRKSVLHIHASHINDRWTIEVGGNCCIVARGQWDQIKSV